MPLSDSLSSFIASGIEFIVGGLMLLSSSAFLLLAMGWEVPAFLADVHWNTQDASWVILGFALAAAYAAGVIGEGLSRLLLEWDLERVTVRTEDFLPERTHRPAGTSLRDRWTAVRLGDGYTATDLSAAKAVREVQRSAVAVHPGLLADIDSQLKRLRIERIAFLCSLLVALGFLWAHQWAELAVTVLVALVTLYLVHERFTRFCGSIARAHDNVEAIQRGSVAV